MAYYNARHLTHRTVPLIRHELDKQLTIMVLVQVLINFCTVLPFGITYMFSKITATSSDPVFQAKVSLASSITLNFSILSYASPFYTYICVSQRFRQQLKYASFTQNIIAFISKICIQNKYLHL
ncbi:unnamed protein product [Adineta steineri]|uniref:Uncharacterized protein n=1 Tax=Adineta steineri TaxID=433720 RepID=A0A814B1G7_9BILA|nr:unnamed protein product [Adineta steineri]CAF0922411.1 unnamed protein product [Adineta steineri]